MNLKPQDFFIGVIDFFSVILPGALVTYFLQGLLYADFFGAGKVFPLPDTTEQQWIIFLFATYIIGNIIFLIAAFLLDKFVYDKYLRKRYFKKNCDLSYHTATAIRDQYLPSESLISQLINAKKLKDDEIEELLSKDRPEIINTFKWAQYFLSIKFPEILVDIRKVVADSKFFRSLVVAFILIGITLLFEGEWVSGFCFFVLSLLSLFRYGDLRYKSTQKAYELIITVEHLEKASLSEADKYSWDNRYKFKLSKQDMAPYQERVSALVKGLHAESDLLAIPTNTTWSGSNASGGETLCCMSGRCVAKISTDNGEDEKVVISPNALIPLPSKASFEISNTQPEQLLLLAVKQ